MRPNTAIANMIPKTIKAGRIVLSIGFPLCRSFGSSVCAVRSASLALCDVGLEGAPPNHFPRFRADAAAQTGCSAKRPSARFGTAAARRAGRGFTTVTRRPALGCSCGLRIAVFRSASGLGRPRFLGEPTVSVARLGIVRFCCFFHFSHGAYSTGGSGCAVASTRQIQLELKRNVPIPPRTSAEKRPEQKWQSKTVNAFDIDDPVVGVLDIGLTGLWCRSSSPGALARSNLRTKFSGLSTNGPAEGSGPECPHFRRPAVSRTTLTEQDQY